jgi:pSer/pThr/pTyr-binding forkhead associated (FHA) protein
MSALPSISVFKKGEEIKSLPVADDILLGRGDNCVIRLDDKAVSRQHAIFRRAGKDIEVEKRSEFAPIIVNGEECDRKTLKHGDVVEIGPYRVKVTIPEEPKKEERYDGPIGVEEVSEEVPSADSENHTSLLNVDFTQNGSKKPARRGDSENGEVFSFEQKKSLKRQREENDRTSNTEGTAVSSEPISEDEPTRIQARNVEARIQIPDGFAAQPAYDLGEGSYTIGRGKGCDIVLLDKKSSRKNSEIRKDGSRFLIRDLDSANGTFVNGKPIKEQELYHDDLIRIGEAQIRFIALNKAYEKKKEEIDYPAMGAHTSQIVVPLVGEDPALSGQSGGFSPDLAGLSAMGEMDPGAADHLSSGPSFEEPAAPKAGPLGPFYQKYVRGYKDLKPVQKLIPLLGAAAVAFYFFGEDLGIGEPANTGNAPTVQTEDGKSKNGSKAGTQANGEALTKTYATLSADEKKYVDTQTQLVDDAFKAMDYDKALFEVKKIYRVLPDYDRAKELERYSVAGKRRLEVKAEEKRKKDEAERVRARIAELVEVAAQSMEKKDYEAAKTNFEEIMTLDPENKRVGDWKKEILAVEEEKARIEMEARIEREKDQLAKDTFNEAMALHKRGDFHGAIPVFERVLDIRSSDQKLTKKAEAMRKQSEKSIRNLREPLLARAKGAENDGRLSEAYKFYEKATRVDPPHQDGYLGMDRIRDALTERAKAIYVEAILQESYSDFKGAFSRYRQILETAPEGSEYYMKAKRKLRAYQNFNPEEA